jgi:hypothetical protein
MNAFVVTRNTQVHEAVNSDVTVSGCDSAGLVNGHAPIGMPTPMPT